MLPFVYFSHQHFYQLITSKVPSEHESPWPQVPSTACASPPVRNSLPVRAVRFSFRRLEWLEVCVLGITTTKWKDFLSPVTAFFFFWGGVVNYSNSFMFSVLPIKLLRLH